MKARVLVCDDNGFLRWALSSHLREEGYNVFEAKDGYEAINQIKNTKPEVIFLDLCMPNADGFYVLDELKKMIGSPKVFIISGVGQSEINFRAYKYGIKEYIKKPFRFEVINKSLEKVLGK